MTPTHVYVSICLSVIGQWLLSYWLPDYHRSQLALHSLISCDWEVTRALMVLLISLHFECAWCVSVLAIELLPQDSEHASRLCTRITLTHVQSEVKLTVQRFAGWLG